MTRRKQNGPWAYDGNLPYVLDYFLGCCRAWEPQARLLGNARAGDIIASIAALRAERDAMRRERDLWKDAHGTHTEKVFDEMVKERDEAARLSHQYRGERDAALAKVKEVEGECDRWVVNASEFSDGKQQALEECDALKADNERLRGLLAGVLESLRVIDESMPEIGRRVVRCAFMLTEPEIRRELGQ